MAYPVDGIPSQDPVVDEGSFQQLNQLLRRMPVDAGETFFADVAKTLSETFGLEHVVVAKICDPRYRRANSLAYWHRGEIQDNFSYDLAKTPCSDIYQGRPSHHRVEVKKKFPALDQLFPMPLESYYGVPLLSSRGKPLGHIAMLSCEPIELNPVLEHYAALIAVRVALHLEQRELEVLLDQQIRTLKQTAENLPGVVYRFAFKEKGGVGFTYISPQIDRVIGIEREALLEDPWLLVNMTHPDDRKSMLAAVEASLENLTRFDWSGRVLIGGEERYLHLSSIPVEQPNGAIESSGYMTDITEIKATEEALRQSDEKFRRAQKMEAIGRLAGGVAHDFNNLLTAILGFGELSIESLDDQHPAWGGLKEILRAGERAQELTRKLVAVGRKQILEILPLDFEEILYEMEPLLRRTLGDNIELVIESGPEETIIRGDKGSLEQVLLNLAVNARDAMPSGGRLLIRTERSSGEELPERRAFSEGDQFLKICVSDNGCGIEAEDLERIFDPFFTTKPEGKGSGLGLSMVYGIVEHLKGSIAIDSRPGAGATFHLYLPISKERPKVRLLDRPVKPLRGHETVLVVEDDAAVRRFVNRCLKSMGYQVLEVDSGPQALEICRSAVTIDLLLTDVVMPKMNGTELSRQALELRPGLPHLFITGFTQDSYLLADLDLGAANVLLKPFTRDQLGRRVRQMLDRCRPSRNTVTVREAWS